ncbi:MAG: methyltransferase domain-containing protein [Acidobacteria bacterium]|nr:methyltransferase domain-containing protein [Acidobacteriota bacterium]
MNTKKFKTEQEQFWAVQYAQDYMRKNSRFDEELGVKAWKGMLAETEEIKTVLECGCNVGRNLRSLEHVLPEARKSIIEINEQAFDFAKSNFAIDRSFNGSIIDSAFEPGSFDLVFTMGVLIHIHPRDLLANMERMLDYSGRYVLMGEYFNRTPVMLEYQGQKDRLFKCDFGKMFIENFSVKLVDYGFLWGHVYDSAGFDDVTWWLFEKD